jgi:hypothetical protein
MPLPTPSVP